MQTSQISYKGRYKYQLASDYSEDVGVKPTEDVHLNLIDLSASGRLTLRKGYAWDGASGLAFDTVNFMRASLVHDALYELIRNEKLTRDSHVGADFEMKRIGLEDGMAAWRLAIHGTTLRFFGAWLSSPKRKRPVKTAP